MLKMWEGFDLQAGQAIRDWVWQPSPMQKGPRSVLLHERLKEPQSSTLHEGFDEPLQQKRIFSHQENEVETCQGDSQSKEI